MSKKDAREERLRLAYEQRDLARASRKESEKRIEENRLMMQVLTQRRYVRARTHAQRDR
jgi:uncharacterized protein YebE (UPF0316 family)